MTTTTKPPIHPELRERVLRWRKSSGISQTAAAVRVGVPLRTYLRWEYGEVKPRGLYAQLLEHVISTTTK